MDFSFLVLILVAALISAAWLSGVAIFAKRQATFRAPFIISYALGVLFLQPWLIQSWSEAGMFVAMLVMLAFWITAGWIIGAIPAMLIIALASRIARLRATPVN